MGSRILKSACGMNLRTFGPCADATGAPSIMTAARAPIAAAVELHATQRLFIAGSPGPENGRTYLEESSADRPRLRLRCQDGNPRASHYALRLPGHASTRLAGIASAADGGLDLDK